MTEKERHLIEALRDYGKRSPFCELVLNITIHEGEVSLIEVEKVREKIKL